MPGMHEEGLPERGAVGFTKEILQESDGITLRGGCDTDGPFAGPCALNQGRHPHHPGGAKVALK